MPTMRSLFACFFLVACSSPSPANPAPDASNDSTPNPDAGVLACPQGTVLDDSATFCTSNPVASRSPIAISPVRDHHSTAILQTKAGTYLYVFAGTDAWNTIHDDVQRARIADDGSIGAFEVVSHLPAVRAGQCLVVRNNRVTLLGGTDGHMMIASSVTAAIDPNDGSVGAWTAGPDLPEPVMHESCDVQGDWAYAVGGRSQLTGGSSTATVGRAPIGPDGMLGKFEKLADLPVDRSHHQSFVMHDRLYVFGGITGDPVGNMQLDRTDIAFAPIAPDGTLGDWQAAGELAAPLGISNATVYGEAVYAVGGIEKGSVYTSKIRRLTLNADGTLAADVVVGKIMTGRGHVHNCPMNGPFLYSVGGHDNLDKSMGTVDIVKFTSP